MFGKRLKHAHRYQEIINAFLKNGFGYFIYRLGLSESKAAAKLQPDENLNLRSIGERLHTILQSLGPTFIKLGQIASTRRDFVPEEIIRELEKLQDQVTPFPFDKVRKIIEAELGDSLENIFLEFHENPLATASIGQVHTARLPSQEVVAIKVQRPDILPTVETDLEILDDLARLMEARISWARRYQIRKMIDEFAKSLRAELDYNSEGRNGERIAKQFIDDQGFKIPRIHWEYSTKRVLTMEFIQGIKINHYKQLDDEGYDRRKIAERLANSMLQQILIDGFYHGDPHPGNIIILPGNVVALMDFGMVGRLEDETKYQFASLVINLKRGSTNGLIKTLSEMGLLTDETDMAPLRVDIDELRNKYYDIPLSQISLGGAVNDLFTVANRHKVQIPPEFTMLGKALLTMEAIVEGLDPHFSIMKAAEPFGERLFKERYNPKNIAKNAWNQFIESAEAIAELPKDIKEVTGIIKKGKLRLDINIPELQVFLHKLDQISNRLSFSIILLAFSIIMVGLIIGSAIGGETLILWKIPVIEIGFVVATLMFLLMLYTIFRSGKM
ncbi:AarF/ABC1/UbiB kinase family protein [Peribacillus simplex]|uniref:ABC1 kinase family protein n=1 Tax=Peribacillus simplex TaxID=1478 RepID=UPI000F62F6C3|nr:AarF/ABC1/UbiB kinase family protein [Peribacillus simplex]RRN72318.1 AarF/ABC1/UbiB kinase family protein [Peribacillus simplex]